MIFASIKKYFLFSVLLSLFSSSVLAQPTFGVNFNPNTIGPGSNSKMIFIIDNGSGVAVNDLAFSNTLPAGVVFSSPSDPVTTCDMSLGGVLTAPDGSSTLTFSSASVAANTSCTISANVTSSTLGTHMNVSSDLTSDAGNSGPASADLDVVSNLPGFSKSFATSSTVYGYPNTIVFTIDNTANVSRIGNMDFTDNLPPGVVIANPANASTDCVSASLPNTNVIAEPGSSQIILDANGFAGAAGFETVDAGASCQVSVDVLMSSTGTLINETTNLLADFTEAGYAVDQVTSVADDILIVKDFTDDPTPPGGVATLQFTISNRNRFNSATNISFDDDLNTVLPGLGATGLPMIDICGPGSTLTGTGLINLSGASLAPEESCTFNVSVQVPLASLSGEYINTTSSISGDQGGSPFVYSPAQSKLFVQPVPVLTKEFINDPVAAGTNAILRFTIQNTDTINIASDINFIDELTTFLPFPVSAGLPANGFCGAGSQMQLISLGIDRQGISMTGGNLGPGLSCTFDVSVSIYYEMPNGIFTNVTEPIYATIAGVTYQGLPAQDNISIVAAPTLIKEFTDDPVGQGGLVTLEFTMFHPAEAIGDATNIAFTDDLSTVISGLTSTSGVQNDICGVGSSLSGVSTLSFAGGILAPGESCTFSVQLQLPMSVQSGSYLNTIGDLSANVAGVATTGLPAEDSLQVANVTFSKQFLTNPVIPGATTTLRFTVDNSQNTSTVDITSFLDNISGMGAGATISGPAGSNTCGGTPGGNANMFTYSGGSVAAGNICEIEIPVTINAGTVDGLYTNNSSSMSVSVSGNSFTLPPANDVLQVLSDLISFSKQFTDDPVSPGGTVTLEFNIQNLDAANNLTSISFTDDLNAVVSGMTAVGLPVNDVCGTGSQISGTNLLTLTGGNLAPSANCTFTVTLQVPAAAPATTTTNTTSDVTGLIGGLAVSGAPAIDDLVIQSVTFEKSFDGVSVAGGNPVLTYTITNNSLSSGVNSLSFTDDLDSVISGMTAVVLPVNDSCGSGSQMTGVSLLTFSGGNLPASGTCSFSVQLQVPANALPGSYLSTSSNLFNSGLPVADPAVDTLGIEPPPTFNKAFAPSAIGTGQNSVLGFVIDNSASAVNALSLSFTDNFPAGIQLASSPFISNTCGGTLTANPGTAFVSVTGGSVAAGALCEIQLNVTGTSSGVHVNITGDLTSSSGTSGTATANLTVNNPPIFTKAFSPNSTFINGVSLLTFTIDNSSSTEDAIGLSFTDNLPAGMLVANPANLSTTCTGGTLIGNSGASVISYVSGTVAASTTCTVSIDVIANASGSLLNTSGDLTSNLGNSGAASATLTVNPPPAFSKVFTPDSVYANQVSQLTFVLDNTGSNADATAVDFTDTFPIDMFVSTPSNQISTCTGGIVTANAGSSSVSYTGGTIPASTVCSITVDVVSSVPGTYLNQTGDLTSNHGNSGQASDTLTVADIPTLTKTFNGGPYIAGDSVELVFVLTNNSVNTVNGIAFTDDLDAFLTGSTAINLPQADICGAGSLVSGSNIIDFQNGSLAANSSCQFSVFIQIPQSASEGTYINTTSPVSVDLSGTIVSGGAASAASDSLFINMFVPAIPVVNNNILLLTLILGLILITGYYRRNYS